MALNLLRTYEALLPPESRSGPIAYAVARIGRLSSFFVGRDSNSRACILVAINDSHAPKPAPIRLENLEVEFDVQARVTEVSKSAAGVFTIVRCRSGRPDIVRYFFSICETIIRVVGAQPSREDVSRAVAQLARIFEQLASAPTRPVVGLFGELLIIRESPYPIRATEFWRLTDSSRFDFTAGDLRLDVKVASGRTRMHSFSYDQCNPPPGTVAIVASVLTELTPTGLALGELIDEVGAFLAGRVDLTIKLRETVACTLGEAAPAAMRMRFDDKLAVSSLKYFDLRSIPAIRTALPIGVAEVRFRSDLSTITGIDIDDVIDRAPTISDFISQ